MMVIMVTVWCLMVLLLRVVRMAIHIQNPSVHILQYHFCLHCKLQLFVVEPVKLEVKLLIFGSYHREKWHICQQIIVNHSFRIAYLLWNNNSVCLSMMSLALLKIEKIPHLFLGWCWLPGGNAALWPPHCGGWRTCGNHGHSVLCWS